MHDTDKQRLREVIAALEATTDSQWCVGVCRTLEGRNCVLGHVFAMGKDDREGNQWWRWFEERVATTFMIFPVNDGKDEDYQQATPRARCLAYLGDVLAGRRKSTAECMAEGF